MQSPETEIMQICWNQFWKNSWKHIRGNYFWRVLIIWHLCASPPLLHSPPYWSCWRCTVFPIPCLCSEMFKNVQKFWLGNVDGCLVVYNQLDLWDRKWIEFPFVANSPTVLSPSLLHSPQYWSCWRCTVFPIVCLRSQIFDVFLLGTLFVFISNLQMWLPMAYNLYDLPLGCE